jgi:hypothetical protein
VRTELEIGSAPARVWYLALNPGAEITSTNPYSWRLIGSMSESAAECRVYRAEICLGRSLG